MKTIHMPQDVLGAGETADQVEVAGIHQHPVVFKKCREQMGDKVGRSYK